MHETEICLDSSSDESIVGEQAKKLFELCDKDEKGFIDKSDLSSLSEFVSQNEIQEIQKKVEESESKQITREEFTQIIRELVSTQNNNYESSASEASIRPIIRTRKHEVQHQLRQIRS